MKLVEFLNTLAFHCTITEERNKRLEQAANKGFEAYVCACLNELIWFFFEIIFQKLFEY